MRLLSPLMRWITPQQRPEEPPPPHEHDTRLKLAQRRQQALARRVGRLESEADILHRRRNP